MERTPIHVPANRARSSWQIPVPKEREYHNDTRPFEDIEAELTGLGFERIATTHSIPHSDLKRKGFEKAPREYVLWYHPAGVFAQGHSYDMRQYRSPDSGSATVRTLESITLTAAIDFSTGNERRHQSACLVTGGGSVTLEFDGSSVRLANTSVSFTRGEYLFDALENWQKTGRLLPANRWPSEHYVYLPNELLFPVESVADKDVEEVVQQLESLDANRRALQEDFLAKLPLVTHQPIERSFRWGPSGPSTNARDWTLVEYSLREASEAMGLAKKLWPTDKEKALLKHWTEVALGQHGDDAAAWRPWEQGPCGLTLPMMLLYACGSEKAQSRLLEVISKAPKAVVERWVTEVDGAGYTLPLRVLHRAFIRSSLKSNWATTQDLVGVFDALAKRVPVDKMVWETTKRSMPGLLLQSIPNSQDSSSCANFELQSKTFWEVVDAAQDMGVQWDGGVRWRSYPNTMTDKETPAFFLAPESISPEALVAHLGPDSVTPALTRVFLQLRSHRLEDVFGQTSNSQAASRPKMRF